MFKGQLFILVVIYVRNSLCGLDAAYNAGKEVGKLYSMIEQVKLNSTDDIRHVNELFKDGPNQEIRIQMDKIHKQLQGLEKSIISKIIRNSITLWQSEIMLLKCMDTFDIFIESIDEYYANFRQYINGSSYHSNDALQDLVRRMIPDVEDKMRVIRKIITEGQEFLPIHTGLVFAITGHTTGVHDKLCGGPRIISNILMQLFTIVIIAEVKLNVIISFANIYQYTANEEWKIMNSVAIKKFETQFRIYVKLFALNLDLVDALYLRACDPADGIWIRGTSFFELEGTFQTTMFRHHWAQCKHDSCNAVWFDKVYQCHPTIYDLRSSCMGIVDECTYLSAMRACVLKSGPYKFQYVNSTQLGLLGRNFTCPKDRGYIIEDGTGWDFIFAACACNCYRNHNKISLLMMESNVKSNMVITGLRLVRRNNILYIQPQEGKLTANGQILKYSAKWIPIPNYLTESQLHTIDRANRVFFLDDLRMPPYLVLTGVKFNKVTRENVTGFAIEIFGHPFDYSKGTLSSEDSSRISKEASNDHAGMSLLFQRINPIYTRLPHTPSPDSMKYVSLQRSELQDDFGQSTLPLFDSVPITSNPPSALGGIGIFHKGVEGYAGFISLRVYGIKYAKFFHDFQFPHVTDEKQSFSP